MHSETVNFHKLEEQWDTYKKANPWWWMDSDISSDLFNAMHDLFRAQDFTPIINKSTVFGHKRVLMIKGCTGNDGYVATVLSRRLNQNRIAIVDDENIARQLYDLKEPKSPDLLGLKEGIVIFGTLTYLGTMYLGYYLIGGYLGGLAGVTGESLKPYVLQGVKIGFATGILSGISMPSFINYLMKRRYHQAREQHDHFLEELPFEPYTGREAIDFILSVKDGNYEATFNE